MSIQQTGGVMGVRAGQQTATRIEVKSQKSQGRERRVTVGGMEWGSTPRSLVNLVTRGKSTSCVPAPKHYRFRRPFRVVWCVRSGGVEGERVGKRALEKLGWRVIWHHQSSMICCGMISSGFYEEVLFGAGTSGVWPLSGTRHMSFVKLTDLWRGKIAF